MDEEVVRGSGLREASEVLGAGDFVPALNRHSYLMRFQIGVLTTLQAEVSDLKRLVDSELHRLR